MKTDKATTVVHVFKTNVQAREHAEMLCDLIQNDITVQRANFDLEDCDKIFRVESAAHINHKIIALLRLYGFVCEELPD